MTPEATPPDVPPPPLLPQAQAHHAAGRRRAAEAVCKQMLERDPTDAGALHLLAVMAHRQRRPAVALKLARMAAAAAPGVPDFHNTVGTALGDLRRYDEAAAAFRQALALRPAYPEARLNLAAALARANRPDESDAEYAAALAERPADVGGWRDRMAVCHDRLDLPGMLDCLRRVTDILPADAAAGSDLLYTLHYSPDYTPEQLFAAHRAWADRHERPVLALPGSNRPHANAPDPERRLRVGYVSGAFRQHPVPRFQSADFQHHDRSRVELVCYSDVAKPDETTDRLRAWADGWVETAGWADEQVAERVRADGIDVLVDLTGHDVSHRLLAFARRPAPVQVTCNGYMNTTGMAAMGWRLTDDWHDPPGASERFHTERLYRVPGGLWCYAPDGDAPPVAEAPAVANGFVTFGSLNKLIKVTESAARLWARVLAAVPRSRLLLAARGGDAAAAARRRLEGWGVPGDRLVLADKAKDRRAYLDRFGRIDVALDPLPFNGITTTCDGLWMGVPLVTLAGDRFVSRSGASLMNAAGLPDLVARTDDEYVRVAAELANDLPRLAALRRGLRGRMAASPLCDGPTFARKLEAAWRHMWRDWTSASSVEPCRRQTGGAVST